MYTVMVPISGQFPRARSLCVQISANFQGQEVQKGQRINERLVFDFQSLDFVDSVALSNWGQLKNSRI
jgi:anti-anti-sigma regulatory factor